MQSYQILWISSIQDQLVKLVAFQLHLSLFLLASQQNGHILTLVFVVTVVKAEVGKYFFLLGLQPDL